MYRVVNIANSLSDTYIRPYEVETIAVSVGTILFAALEKMNQKKVGATTVFYCQEYVDFQVTKQIFYVVGFLRPSCLSPQEPS